MNNTINTDQLTEFSVVYVSDFQPLSDFHDECNFETLAEAEAVIATDDAEYVYHRDEDGEWINIC